MVSPSQFQSIGGWPRRPSYRVVPFGHFHFVLNAAAEAAEADRLAPGGPR